MPSKNFLELTDGNLATLVEIDPSTGFLCEMGKDDDECAQVATWQVITEVTDERTGRTYTEDHWYCDRCKAQWARESVAERR